MASSAENNFQKSTVLFWGTLIVLILLRLWLVGAQKLCALPHNRHDDQLFMNLATNLVQGQWLGIYDNLTLAKGPFYSIWIAAVFWLGVPLVFTQNLLYAAACLVFIKAIKPLFRSQWLLVLVFAAIIFEPVSFSILESLRITREGIYPALSLFVLACAAGIMVRFRSKPAEVWGWVIGLSISLAAFWLTREESIWLLPSLAVIITGSLIRKRPRSLKEAASFGFAWGIPLIITAAALYLVSSLNNSYYGVFAKTEFEAKPFLRAYGALTRVKSDTWLPHVPVSRQMRRRIYRISPAFNELRPYLEGNIGAQFNHFGFKQSEYENEIQGGWFMWAFRDAVAAAGYYGSGKFPAAYYNRVAKEINTACQKGRIECTSERATMLPLLQIGYAKPFWTAFQDGIQFLLRFDKVYLEWNQKSLGTEEETRQYRDLSREELCRENEETVITGRISNQTTRDAVNMQGYFGENVPFIFVDTTTNNNKAGSSTSENSDEAHFEIRVQCPVFCYLILDPSGAEPLKLEIKPDMPSQSIEKENVSLTIESVEQAPILPEQNRLDQVKLAGLAKITRVYQRSTILLSILALIGYFYLGIRMLRMKGDEPLFWILSALIAGIIVRLILMSLVEVTSFAAITTLYLSPIYPFLMGLIFLVLAVILDLIINKAEMIISTHHKEA